MYFKRSCVLAALVALLTLLAYADINGRIRGTVVDASGAAIPQAAVRITNIHTQYQRTVTTGNDGSFDAPDLAPGDYEVTITKDGFRTFKQIGIGLQTAATYVVSATLAVGPIAQTVEVIAPPLQADTTTMQLGGEIVQAQIKDFPLLNRAWINLQTTLPGVVASSDRFTLNFATNGARTQSNNYLTNGTDSNDLPLNLPLENALNPDAIQEVKVVDSTLNPEYGRNAGATVLVTTKSGNNDWHGSGFEFYRDTFLNAKNFFSQVVPPFHQNQFGGTVGGPIKKNKLFFFFSYQGTRQVSGAAQNVQVFSNAERGGDFSSPGDNLQAATGTSPFALFGDPKSPCPVSGGTPCAAGTKYSSLFSTGVIPTQDFNSVSNTLLSKFIPSANSGTNFFQFVTANKSVPDQYTGRLDYNLSSKDTLFFYLFWSQNTQFSTLSFLPGHAPALPGSPEIDGIKVYQYTISHTHIFNQRMLNEFRIGYTRLNLDGDEPANPVLPSSVGFTGITPQNTKGAGVPAIDLTGLFTIGFSDHGPQPRIDDTLHLTDNFSYSTGKHAFKWGVDIRRGHVSNPFFILNNGTFSFAGGGAFTTGLPGADFLLGIPDSYGQSSGGFIDARAWEYYSYIQDQWRIKSNLTFTYGVGWQIDTPLTDHFNHDLAINAFRPFQQSTVFPTAPQGLVFPGDSGVSASGYRTRYNNFAPRLGFAWSPFQKLTVRAGWGIYYNNSEEELTGSNLFAPPFALADSGIGDVGGSPSFANPFTDVTGKFSIPNKYPFTPPAAGSAVDFTFFEPFSLNVIDPNFNTAYNFNYNLTVQYQVTPTILATFSYVGSQGRRLEGAVEQNPYNAKVCLATPGCPANRVVEFVFPGVGTTADASIFGSIGQEGTFLHSRYDSFQATVEKSLSHGLSLRAAYTYSHALDNASSFENAWGVVIPSNVNATYGDSEYDARHRLVFQYLYQIPDWGFHHLPSRLTKGWTFSGVTTFQTGFPIPLTESDFRTLQCTPITSLYGCWDRPNIVAPVKIFSDARTTQTINGRTGNFFFDPRSFTREALGTIGNAGRDFFHGPGINNWDLSFYKNTTLIGEQRLVMQLRVDLFNAFNHVQFNNPSGNVASPNFGAITSTRIPARITQLSVSFTF